MSVRVWIVQLLCPQRHCIIGVPYEADEAGDMDACARAISDLEAQRTKLALNPWCGICGSKELEYENARTPFATLADVTSDLARLQRENLAAFQHFQIHQGGAS